MIGIVTGPIKWRVIYEGSANRELLGPAVIAVSRHGIVDCRFFFAQSFSTLTVVSIFQDAQLCFQLNEFFFSRCTIMFPVG